MANQYQQQGKTYQQQSGYSQGNQQNGYYQQAQQGNYQQPQQGGYQHPPQGGYRQPPQGGYQQPQQGGYQQPPQGGYQPPQQGGYQQAQQGGYQQAQQGGYQRPTQSVNQPAQGNGGFNQNQNQGENQGNGRGSGQLNYAEMCNSFRPASDAPLEEAFLAVSVRPRETNFTANYVTGSDGSAFLSIKFDAVIPDGTTKRLFGDNMVHPDHVVSFQTTLSGFAMDNFIQHPPRRNQTVIIVLRKMELISYSTKNGTVIAVKGSCWGLAGCGNPFKRDGSISKPINIFGLPEDYKSGYNQAQGQSQGGFQQPQGYYGAPSQGVANGVSAFREMNADDEELPF